MRGVSLIAVLCAVGCGSTRLVEVPPPYDDNGILVKLCPRVYIDWPLRFETIRGTAENRTGGDVDLYLCLSLLDDRGVVVGHASAYNWGFRRGAKWSFEALAEPGPPGFSFSFFPAPPPYSKVARGFVSNLRALEVLVGWVSSVAACLGSSEQPAEPPCK